MKQRFATIVSLVTEGRLSPSVWRHERGAIAVIAVLMLTALVGMAALVVDIGRLYVVRSELQNAADAGALAGVVELVLSGTADAQTMAVAYATQSTQYHLTQPIPGSGAVAVSFPASDRLRVKVGPITVPTMFAGVLGIGTADVSAVAVAKMSNLIIGTGPGNLLPFGVRRSDVDPDDDGNYDIGSTIEFPLDPEGPGNFGLLDFNGGSNSNADTENWIEYGYDDVFVIPEGTGFINVEGDTGIAGNSLRDVLNSRIGDLVLLPVFDQVTGVGGNETFRVVDFVGGIIQGFELDGPQSERHITIQIVMYSSQDLIVGAEGSAPVNSSVSTPVLIQ
jgi:Flp pilus assembly protein TadG